MKKLLTAFFVFVANARATGSLFNMSTANVGPEITATLLVFKVLLTIFDNNSSFDSSIPFDAILIGILFL